MREFFRILGWIILIALAVIGFLALCVYFSPDAEAKEIDLSIIAKIESSNNPMAYNPKSKASGLYQFTPIAWQDVRNNYPSLARYSFVCAYKPQVARLFAEAYFALIDRYLRHFGLKNTLKNKLWAWNAGIGQVVKGKMPYETDQFIAKYKKLVKEKQYGQ